MTDKERWSAYGKWRTKIYTPLSIRQLRDQLAEHYELKDLHVISFEQGPYQQDAVSITCIYPATAQQ